MKYAILVLGLLCAVPAYAYESSASISGSATACTLEYAPVCGYQIRADNQCVGEECKVYKTYSNQCMLGADGATFAHTGECSASELGSKPDKPTNPPEAYTPPAGCIAWYDGCNSCSNGACTMRACLRYEPGYCTKWDESPIPVEPDGGIGDTPTPPVADGGSWTDASTTAGTNGATIGFFARVWAYLSAWF